MRIGIDGRLLDQVQNTGISRYTEFLIKYYIERYGDSAVYVIVNNVNVKGINCEIIHTSLKPYGILDFVRFHSFIAKFGFTIYHSPFYSGFFVKLDKTFSILTVHDLMYKFVDSFFSKNSLLNYLKRAYFNFIVDSSMKCADRIISVSDTTKEDVKTHFGFESVHIPEDSSIESIAAYSILEKYELSVKSFFFYCGNNRPHKNLEFIIEVFNKNPHLPTLVLAGRGHVNSLNVLAVGLITDGELRALYESATALIFPSKYEGFGLPVLEALRCETFVVCSNIPAFREFDSRNIFYFDLGNEEQFKRALAQVQSSEFENEPVFFEQYSVGAIYDQTDQLLRMNYK